jgi:tetratricopeptide (TPR) repeat protein
MASRRVLEAATINNAPFALEDIQGATALSEWENLEGLERAVQAQVVWQKDNLYQFTHDLTRLALESAISQERKQFIHRKLAATLEPRSTAPARIAWHLEQAGQQTQAVMWRIQAAQAAEQVFAYQEAQTQYRLALENRTDVPSTFEAQIRMVRLNEFLNQPDIWQQDLEQLEQDSAKLSEETQISVQLERIHFLIWHAKDEEAFEASQALVKHNLSTLQRAQVLEYQAYALANFGRLDESDALRSEVIAMLSEPHKIRGQAMYGCMMSAYKRSQHDQALAWCERCQTEFQSLGLRHYLINTNIMVGILAVIQGEAARAVKALEFALEEAQNLSDSYRSLASIFNLCEVYFELGNLEAIQHKLEQVKVIQRHFIDPFTEGAYVRNQSLLAWYTGQLGQAIIYAKKAHELDERSQALEHRLLGRLTLAGFYLELGAISHAEPLLQEFKALRQDSSLEFLDMTFALQSTDLLLQQSQTQEALAQLEKAEALLPNARTDEQAQYKIWLARVYMQLGNNVKALAALEPMPKQYSLWNQQRFENLRRLLLPKKTKPKPKITQTNLLLLEYQSLHQLDTAKRSQAQLLLSLEEFPDLQVFLRAKF